MARELRTTCEGCDFLRKAERNYYSGEVALLCFFAGADGERAFGCAHPPKSGFGRIIGPRPETPEWCPLEEK